LRSGWKGDKYLRIVSDLHPGKGEEKPVGTLVSELAGLVIAYFKQETVIPIKALGRYILYGIIGAVLISIGAGLLSLTVVRLLQAETGASLTGSLTWVPYVGGILVGLAGAALAANRIMVKK
jgi:hypothetical protein